MVVVEGVCGFGVGVYVCFEEVVGNEERMDYGLRVVGW